LLLPRAGSSRCSIEGKNLLLQQRGTACRNLGGVGEGRDEKAVLGPPL
jgi:ribosomal protein L27